MSDATLLDRLRALPGKPALEPWRDSAARLGRFFLLTFKRTHRDGVLLTSGALAYITILSLIPLLAAFTFVGARIFERYQQRTLDVFVQVLPYHEATVTNQLEEFLSQAEQLQGWGLLAFFATALFAFANVEETVNRIWNVSSSRPWRVRLLSFTLLIFWGPILIGATHSSLFLVRRTLGDRLLESSVVLNLVPFLATLLGLTMLYWLVPYTSVSFRCALSGGLAAAILLELLRQGFGLWVGVLANPSQVYGRFAFLLFFAISIQVAWTIVLYGSEVSYCAQHYRALAKGLRRHEHLQGRWLGLAAVLHLTERFESGEPIVEIDPLADRLVVPPGQLNAVLEPLVERGILRTTEGRERGFLLTRPPHKIHVVEVLAAYDEGGRRAFEPLSPKLRALLDDLAARLEDVRGRGLAECSLADLLEGDVGCRVAEEADRGPAAERAGE